MTNRLEQLKAALGDRYTIERGRGNGGMAQVYLALDLKHEHPRACLMSSPPPWAPGDSFGRSGSAQPCTHGHGTVHRDIKPENSTLSRGVAVAADLGITRVLRAKILSTGDANSERHPGAR